MRIVHITTSVLGGAGLAAFRLHQTMLKGSYNSVLFSKTYENKGLSCFKIDHEISNNKIQKKINSILFKIDDLINKIYDSFNFEYHSSLRTNYRIHKYCKSNDIIILHWVADFLDYKSFFSNIGQDSKIYLFVHDLNCVQGKLHTLFDKGKIAGKPIQIIESYYQKKKLKYFRKIKNLKVIANSDYTLKTLKDFGYFSGSSLHRIKLGIPNNELRPTDKKIAKQELGFEENDFLVLTSANNLDSELKGIDRYLNIINTLKSNKKIKFIGLGKTQRKSLLENGNFFNYSTWEIDKKSMLFSAADVTLSTSYEETFGQTIIESYACSTPVIVFNNAALPELVHHNKTGFIAENDNDVINYINLLYSNSELKEKISKSVRNVFLKDYTSEVQSDKIYDILSIKKPSN